MESSSYQKEPIDLTITKLNLEKERITRDELKCCQQQQSKSSASDGTKFAQSDDDQRQLVCAWLACYLCGYLAEDSPELERHFKNHKDEDFLSIKDIKCELDIENTDDENDCNNMVEICEKLSEKYVSLPISLPICDPIAVFDAPMKPPTNPTVCTISLKPFVCHWCPQRSSTKKKLDEHMRVHTGERPYRCRTCGYATRNASALSYHLKTHKEDRPYTCNLCNYRNTTLSSLRSHKTRVHMTPTNITKATNIHSIGS